MNKLALGIAIIVLLLMFVEWMHQKAKKGIFIGKPWPFYAKRPLSLPEQVLYFRLIHALPDHIVLAQVQLSRVLGVKKGYHYQSWLNRIHRMSADFVICHKDASILAVIELDDASHQHPDRQAADIKKEAALNAANIKMVRWHAKTLPDVSAIQASLLAPVSSD